MEVNVTSQFEKIRSNNIDIVNTKFKILDSSGVITLFTKDLASPLIFLINSDVFLFKWYEKGAKI